LEEVNKRGVGEVSHAELLRTCYLKLNDKESATELDKSLKLVKSRLEVGDGDADDGNGNASDCSDLPTNPAEALRYLCTLQGEEVATSLLANGANLARSLPKETAGLVMSLCDGTFKTKKLHTATTSSTLPTQTLVRYGVDLFSHVFVHHPKLFRIILSHCRRKHCRLNLEMRRALLELTLEEWAERREEQQEGEQQEQEENTIDILEAEILGILTVDTEDKDNSIPSDEALVLVMAAGFTPGEILLLDRLHMQHMLLDKLRDEGEKGGEKGAGYRRMMVEMCERDGSVTGEVLRMLVELYLKLELEGGSEELTEVTEDIEEVLEIVKRGGGLGGVSICPTRIIRILAGQGYEEEEEREGEGEGEGEEKENENETGSLPLSVAVDYVTNLLTTNKNEVRRLEKEIDSYEEACRNMEEKLEALQMGNLGGNEKEKRRRSRIDVLMDELGKGGEAGQGGLGLGMGGETSNNNGEWIRQLEFSENRFDLLASFFYKK